MSNIDAVLSDLRRELAGIYDGRLSKLILYGSHARGDAREDSDIDVMVVLKGEVNACAEIARTVEAVSKVSLAHDTVVCCMFSSIEEAESEESPLLINVRREGQPF